ncbi:hypothetical protein MHYP_G00004600 [Metynnis hypsauchen]
MSVRKRHCLYLYVNLSIVFLYTTLKQVLQSIMWPHARSTFEDSDGDDMPEETLTLVSAFFRRFVEQASSDSLNMLMRFWVGWEVPP